MKELKHLFTLDKSKPKLKFQDWEFEDLEFDPVELKDFKKKFYILFLNPENNDTSC